MSMSGANQIDVEDGGDSQRDIKILELKKAAEDGDVMSLQKLMASNPELLYWESVVEKNTALHIAASKGHIWFIHDFLIFMGLNCELLIKENLDGDTSLHLAIRAGHLDVVEHLIQYVAWARNMQNILKDPLMVQNNKHNTLLHESVIHSRCDVATKLLASAKEVRLKGSTLEATVGMHITDAKEDVRLDFALLLLWNAEKHTPLHMAVKDNNLEMVEMLIKYDQDMKHDLISGKHTKVPKNMDMALRKAAEVGNVQRLEILDNSGPDTVYDTLHSVTQIEQNTILHIAASRGHEPFIRKVLQFDNMDIELIMLSENVKGDTPLHLAVKAGHLAIIDYLLQHVTLARQIYPNLKEPLIMLNREGNTLLHEAAIKGLDDVVDFLLEHCRREEKWSTPKAIIKERNEYVDHDIKRNDVFKIWGPIIIANKEGNNLLHLVAMNRMSGMALKILDDFPRYGYMPNRAMESPLYIVVMNGLDHVINKITNQGHDDHIRDKITLTISTNGTAIHQAVLADNINKHLLYASVFNQSCCIYFLFTEYLLPLDLVQSNISSPSLSLAPQLS